MGQLAEVLYPMPDRRRTPVSLLKWWESRRIIYNQAVALAGLTTVAGVYFFFWLPPFWPGPPPLSRVAVGCVLYALMANFCYSLGWMVELTARKLWGDRSPDLGPLLFREGLIFSVGLTLVPLGLAGLAWGIQVLSRLAG